jgi:cysteinyl-tRNA synthetase
LTRHDTALKLYNTASRRIETFTTADAGKVGMYVCGVTVYNVCHIGHGRAYVAFDVLLRTLRHLGLEVTYVRNFTDVDDKIINAAAAEGVDPLALSARYIDCFTEDMQAIGVAPADVEPKVSEHIDEIIAMTERLIARGHAYESGGDVYFAVRSFPTYGALSGRDLDDLRAGARVAPGDLKRDPLDFALWKTQKPGELAWPSPWGDGRPGWHIECSAMSCAHLGASVDLHGGGSDLIFPHHENEVAQSEGASGKKFVTHWAHNGFVNIDNEKMSKSLGNFFTIREVLKKFSGEALRYFLLTTHYRQPINFSDHPLTEAEARVGYLYETLDRMDRAVAEGNTEREPLPVRQELGVPQRLHVALCDDLNTPQVLGLLADVLRTANALVDHPPATKGERKRVAATLAGLRTDLDPLLRVLALGRHNPAEWLRARRDRLAAVRGLDLASVAARIAERSAAKAARDFAAADAIRAELSALGVTLFDRREGTDWQISNGAPTD